MMESLSSLFQEVGGRFFLAAMPPAFLLVLSEAIIAKVLVRPEAEPATFPSLVESLLSRPIFWAAVVLTALGLLLANGLLVQFWTGRWWLLFQPFMRGLRSVWRRSWRRPAPISWQDRSEALGGEILLRIHERSSAPPGAGEESIFPLRLALANAWNEGGLQARFVPTLPTALGRILQAMEAGPATRYRIDAVHAWSRILLVVPGPLAEQYRLSKTWLDLVLHLASALIVLAVSATVLLHPASAAAWGAITVLLLASYPIYRLSLPFATGMRLAFEAAFDLYRGDLLKAWGLRQPPSLHEEQLLWSMIQEPTLGEPLPLPRRVPPQPAADGRIGRAKRASCPATLLPGGSRLGGALTKVAATLLQHRSFTIVKFESFSAIEELGRHSPDHTRRVLVAQVSVPFDHCQRLVPEHIRDLGQCATRHCQIARTAMAQIVKAKILDPCPDQHGLPGTPRKARAALVVGEEEVRPKASDAHHLLHYSHRHVGQWK
jgi:hypothetical protein